MKSLYRITIALIIVFLLLSFNRLDSIDLKYVQANGSVTVDGPVSSGAFRGDLTLSHTTGIGENRLLLVGMSWGNGEAGTAFREIIAIEFAGIPLDLVIQATQDFQNQVAIYCFPGEPPESLTANLFIDFSSNNTSVVVGAINFAGVDLVDPFFDISTSIGFNSLPSLEIETQEGVLVFDTISTLFTTLMADTSQVEQWNFEESMSTNKKRGAASTQTANATTTTMSWIPGYIEPWAMAAVAIKPAIPGIGDYVWIDQNGDGIQDDGEPGLPDIIVELFQEDGTLTAQTTTDATGHYFFEGIPAGEYYLKFSHPTIDLTFTSQDQGTDETVDSDADVNGFTSAFPYTADISNKTFDAGVLPPANPPLTTPCGLDIALVIDSSECDDADLGTMKTAFQNFASTLLPTTPTRIALIDYDTIAKVWDFTNNQWDDAVASEDDSLYWSNDLTAINSAIGSLQNNGNTNYDDALSDAHALFAFDRDDNPDLIIFSTHSHTNQKGADGTSSSELEAMAAAIQKAFLIKSDEIRILSMGIGTEFDPTNLTAISGSKIDTSPVKDADVITSDFPEISNKLDSLAKNMCGGTCTIHNVIDQDAILDTRDDWITEGDAVKDWEFIITNLGSGLSLGDGQVNPVMTGMDGQSIINFIVTSSPAAFNLQETTPDGWELLDVECFSNRTPLSAIEVTETIVSGISFTDNYDILSCYFYNNPTPSAVTLLSFTAKFESDSVLLKWETASEIDNLGFNLYREEAQSGVKEKINPELIPSKLPGSTEGALYDFYDESVDFGEVYAYWLEAIDFTMQVKDSYGPVNVIWWQFFLPIFSLGN